MTKIQVEYYDRDPGPWIREIEPTMKAIGDLLHCDVEQLSIRVHKSGKLEIRAPSGDTVLITGMGHEVYRIVAGERIPWNDSDVVREILDKK